MTKKTFPYKHKLKDSIPLDTMYNNLLKYSKLPTNKLGVIKSNYCPFGILIRSYPNDYNNCDSISNYFTEKERICASVANNKSPYILFNNMTDNELKRFKDDTSLRDYFFKYEANLFNPTISINLIKNFKIKKILDPCSGWGDRLIAALICNVDQYLGFDTNTKLETDYNNIINYFNGSKSKSKSNKNIKIHIQPFETASSLLTKNHFDCVLTSPPFWTIEIYEGKNTSTNLYKTYDEWIKKFYTPFLIQSYESIIDGGYIFLYITYVMFEAANSILVNYNCKYIGSFGFYQSNSNKDINSDVNLNENKIRYTYIWQKY
jgi:hypothetical protein